MNEIYEFTPRRWRTHAINCSRHPFFTYRDWQALKRFALHCAARLGVILNEPSMDVEVHPEDRRHRFLVVSGLAVRLDDKSAAVAEILRHTAFPDIPSWRIPHFFPITAGPMIDNP